MKALNEGTFPFYVDYNLLGDYGYFVKAFYPDLTLLPYAVLGNYTDIGFAYNFLIFSITVLTGITMYFLCKRLFSSVFVAVAGGLLYAFSFYTIFLNLYYASLPYALVLAFLPGVFLGFYELVRGNYNRWYIFVIGFTLIINSHLITTVLTSCILFFFLIFSYRSIVKEKKRLIYILISSVFCLCLSAYYILPMAEQIMSNSFYFQTHPFLDISFNRLSLSRIFLMMTDNSYKSDYSDYYPKVGYILTGIIFLRIFIREKSKAVRYADIGVITGFFFLFLCTTFIPWNVFPFSLFKFIQFPARFLVFVTLFFSVSGAVYLSVLLATVKRKTLFILFFSLFTLVSFKTDSSTYRQLACKGHTVTVTDKIIKENVRTSGLEYLPSKVPSKKFLEERGNIIDKENDSIIVSEITRNKNIFSFSVNTEGTGDIEFPLIYYKGYKAVLNGNDLKISESDNGLIQLTVNQSGDINVWYDGTIIQKVSVYISLISLVIFVVLIFISNRKRENA